MIPDKTPTSGTAPNPGSDAAIVAGCTCPVIDNAYGRGDGCGNFWYTDGCPVHAPRQERSS
jgi:hypothetical protein